MRLFNGSCGNNSMSDFSGFAAICAALLRPVLAPHRHPCGNPVATADVRQHLTPVLTTRPATNHVTLCGLMPQACTTSMPSASDNPRLPALLAPVHWGHVDESTKENPFRLGIIVWCTLARKIGRNQTGSALSSACRAAVIKEGHCSGRLISRPNPDTKPHSHYRH